jgi:RimJ/RimL family protein N-acetyltransferase
MVHMLPSFEMPLSLQGHAVHLTPLSIQDAPSLWACATPDIFTYLRTRPQTWTYDSFAAYLQNVLVRPNSYPLVILLAATGGPVGITGYIEIQPDHRGLEIGGTWIAVPYQGTTVNPESKYLLLWYAFEKLHTIRVQIKTDVRNLKSQRAIEKLGAVREGVFRKHLIVSDGHVRDTVYYSITDDDWPDVKTRLEARLGFQYSPPGTVAPGAVAAPAPTV